MRKDSRVARLLVPSLLVSPSLSVASPRSSEAQSAGGQPSPEQAISQASLFGVRPRLP